MERRALVFMDAKSNKFWNIELNGSSHSVTYGRAGTDGQTKEKDFDSDEKAKASFDKLVKQKLDKGYVDADDSGSADSDEIPTMAFASVTKVDDLRENVKTFIGRKIADYDQEKGARAGGKTIYRFRADWDENTFIEDLQHFFDSDASIEAVGIVIGNWAGDDSQYDSSEAIQKLVDNKARLPNLKAIYLGDIVSEENEMSWIQQSDISPLLKAFPKLELLRVRGGTNLSISTASHKSLRALAIETGGLGNDCLRAICTAKFPNLEHLELWLGTNEYGGDCSVQDLQPILTGKLFPKLKYLGFRNCEFADDIAGVVVNSPIIEQIEVLDLSLGVMTDTGAQALLSLPTGGKLKKVSIHHNFATKPMLKKLKDLKVAVDTSNPGHMDSDDDEWRFVAVGE